MVLVTRRCVPSSLNFPKVLLLNATYEPLQVVTWQKAMVLWIQEKVDVLESHDQKVRSVKEQYSVPAVLRLRYYIQPKRFRRVRLSRENIFLRDNYTCQYCCKEFQYKELTLDHVMPASRGGPKSWKNLVAACHKCNHKKGSRTPREANMPLLQKPVPLKWTPQFDVQSRIKAKEDLWSPYLSFQFS